MGPCCSGLLVGESSACFWASGSSVPLRAVRETPELLQFARGKQGGRRMRSYPWSSPGNFLFLLPDMVMWHLQQVAPIRSEHSVTVTPPEVQTPCDRATQPAQNPAGFYYMTFSLQDWFIFLDDEKRNPFVFFCFSWSVFVSLHKLSSPVGVTHSSDSIIVLQLLHDEK